MISNSGAGTIGYRAFHATASLVANTYKIPLSSLLGRRRTKTVLEPRHMTFFLCRHVFEFSYPEIGEIVKRDHSSVMSSVKKANKMFIANRRFSVIAATLMRVLDGQKNQL